MFKKIISFLFPCALLGVGVLALIEQGKPNPNKIILFGAMALFMIGLFRIMNKIPSRSREENTNIQDDNRE